MPKKITIQGGEFWDEENEQFLYGKDTTITIEHSLVSVSKWESKWHKRFLDKSVKKTREEEIDYIRCMTITQNVDPEAYYRISSEQFKEIFDYIEDPATASIVYEAPENRGCSIDNEPVSSELIYYWMITYGIPVEFQKWHLNRLMILIKICNVKNAKPKQMSENELYRRNSALNAARQKMR